MSRRRIYVSAARDEPESLRELIAGLRRNDFDVVHSTAADVEPGDNWAKRVRESVSASDLLLALITPGYLSDPLVYTELAAAINGRKRIVPMPVPGAEIPAVLRPYQPVEASFQPDAVDRLADQLRSTELTNPVDAHEELRSVATQRMLVAGEARYHHVGAPADELLGALFRRIGSARRHHA
jgi:TIR domain-containing protein